MAMEGLSETLAVNATVIESSGKAVVRHDIGQVIIGQSMDVADVVTGFAPNLFCTVVTVLNKESAVVDTIVDHIAGAAPVGKVRHALRDVVKPLGAKVADNAIGV